MRVVSYENSKKNKSKLEDVPEYMSDKVSIEIICFCFVSIKCTNKL